MRKNARQRRMLELEPAEAERQNRAPPERGESSVANTVNDVDLSQMENQVEEAKRLLQRFHNLLRFETSNLNAGTLKNGGFEKGRPKAVLSDALKGDTSDVFTRPSLDALHAMNFKSEALDIITAQEQATIMAKLVGLGVPPQSAAPLCWSIARYCADTSSSAFADPKGTFEFQGGAIMRDAVYAVIREVSTLRAFCRAFAPITWNAMITAGRPPANWAAKGYTEETKYAAFDVFEYVTNPAAIQPLEGLLRRPTLTEIIAHETNKRLALDRNRRNARFASTSSLVTVGMTGKDIKTSFNGSNNSD
uniref:Capsid protein n=1 Tax=Coleus vein necrosis virus TaxID=404404 RepID=Q06B60_9VIRU|nr:coat protein [Coleus vein necrosis virus]